MNARHGPNDRQTDRAIHILTDNNNNGTSHHRIQMVRITAGTWIDCVVVAAADPVDRMLNKLPVCQSSHHFCDILVVAVVKFFVLFYYMCRVWPVHWTYMQTDIWTDATK